MSNFSFNRQDPKSAEAVLEKALPKYEERIACLQTLADAIKYAHELAPAAWSTTLHKNGFCLNLGSVAVLFLEPRDYQTKLYLALDWIPEDLITLLSHHSWCSEYRTVPGETWFVWLPKNFLTDSLPYLKEPMLSFIQRAAVRKNGQTRISTPYFRSFSSAVPKYLSQVLDVPFYLPSWYSITPEVDDYSLESESDPFEADNVGAGFGSTENNRLVEEKAVSVVKNELEEEGWQVESVERLNIGYDLLCKRSGEELHIEVKGISGLVVSFIITPNELRTAKNDERFVLYAVTKTLTENPTINIFLGKDIEVKFRLEPTAFRAILQADS